MIVTSVSTWLLGGFLILVLLIAFGFATSAQYARKESVSGWIVPEAGAVRVAALRGGIVEDVLSAPGDMVSTGDTLASISLSVVTEGGDLGENLKTSLSEQLEAAREQLAATEISLDTEQERLTRQRENVSAEKSALFEQESILTRRIETTRDNEIWARENFEEGLTTRVDAENWAAALMELEQEQTVLKLRRAQYQTRIEEIDQQLAALPGQRLAAQADFAVTRTNLDERATRAASETSYSVTSPIKGRVETVSVEAGQTISPGTPIVVMTPEGSELIAELFVPSRAIGFVETGQSVQLKYDAFPFQRFGVAHGKVFDVSRTILAPAEVAMAGAQFHEPVFRVRVALASDQIEAYGDSVNLRSGMMLSADIIIDRRSLLEWLLDPLYAVGRRS